MYYFTFGAGQEHDGEYVIINQAMFAAARQVMVARFGIRWSGQYSQQQFNHLGLASKMQLVSTFNEGEWHDIA
jgi:hypothetical protein